MHRRLAIALAIGLSARSSSITQGPDGNLWFVEPHKNNVGRLQ
jgi:streptogramin lyase